LDECRYVESPRQKRGERMADSARLMGVTVVMGALTTLGAGMFLWMCTLTFFTKFAVRKPIHFMIVGALVHVTVGGLVTVHN
jgi:hypothetical protein